MHESLGLELGNQRYRFQSVTTARHFIGHLELTEENGSEDVARRRYEEPTSTQVYCSTVPR
jgi:hypothetical protein